MSCGCGSKFNFMTALSCCSNQPIPSTQCDVGYIFNFELKDSVHVAQNAYIEFLQPALTRGGITHDEIGAPAIIGIGNTGIYEVTFYVSGGPGAIIGIEISDPSPPTSIPTSLTYTTVANEAVYGQALIQILVPNSILRLKVLNKGGIDLAGNPNFDPNDRPFSVNASVVIEKVCNA